MIRRTASAAVVVLLAAYSAPAAEKELHVVVAKHGGAPWDEKMATATVRVDRPGKEVVLLVAGGEYVEWDVSATPKTKLAKVIVGGFFRQRVRAPEGVTVLDRLRGK